MSVKKWQQLAEEKTVLDKQTEEIHQKFKMNEINKEFGQLSGDEFFKPIAKRLDEKSSATTEEEEEEEEEEKRGRKFLITQWMNLTKFTLLVMNSDRMHHHQNHHHHQHHHLHQHHHPHIMKLLMIMIFHNRPHH